LSCNNMSKCHVKRAVSHISRLTLRSTLSLLGIQVGPGWTTSGRDHHHNGTTRLSLSDEIRSDVHSIPKKMQRLIA